MLPFVDSWFTKVIKDPDFFPFLLSAIPMGASSSGKYQDGCCSSRYHNRSITNCGEKRAPLSVALS